jgi:hypothetical protein
MSRKLTYLALLALVLGLVAGTATAKLVAYYPLSEGTGATTADASGNGHDGTIQGTPTWVDGPPGLGKALSYNGQGTAAGWVNCGTWNPSAATGQLTVTYWARWNGSMGPDSWQGLVGKRNEWDDTGVGQMWEFEINATNNQISFFRGGSYPNCGGRILPTGEWTHIAVTFDGTTMIFYIDGQETGRGAFSFGPTTDATITIGCDNSSGWNAFNGALDEVRIYDSVLPPTEIKKLATRFGATKPSPADGAVVATNMANLTWTSGSTAVFHEIYLGTSYDDVFNGTGGTFRAKQPVTLTFYLAGIPGFAYPTGLPLGQTYYWRIDEVDLSGTKYKGPVWSFLVPSKKAYTPSPADTAQFVDPNADLAWSPGLNAIIHHVFLGESFEDVNNATEGITTGEISFDPGTLAFDKTYYWRVDEFDAQETHRGDVWSFRTTPPGLGGITQEIYENMNGDLAAFKASPNYPDNPTSTAQLTAFETPGWGDTKDNYGGRMHGWVYVPVAGEYTFWVASDDTAELWLSQDDDPGNAQLIASVPGWTGTGEWEKYPVQKSQPIKLDASRYYIMALWQDGILGDHCEVAWQGPGIPKPEIIPGIYLKPFEAVSAFGPRPFNKATGVEQTSTLSWKPGVKAAFHDVYFGDSEQAVADANTATAGIYKGQQLLSETTFDPGPLAWGKTYYWRIDEVNDAAADSPWKGGVWSFTAADFIVVDDFESYTDDTGNRIFQSWIDGFGYTDPVVVPGNGTGSTVGNIQPPFAEQTIVHGGRQAMPMDYDNTATPFYSEATTTWTSPQNWTINGMNTLSLQVRGYPQPTSVTVTEAGGKMTLTGSGSDIWNNTDEFTYAYKSLNGDATIVAKVTSNGTGTNTWAKGGVMIRDSLDGGSIHAMMVITGSGGNGASFQYRNATDGASGSSDSIAVVAPPYWVKLERAGDTFTGYSSADGSTWTMVATQDVVMTAPVYIGICVTAHEATEQRTYQFESIKTTGSVSGAWQGAVVNSPRYNSPQSLYVVFQDSASKVAVVSDATAVNSATWTEVRMPLSSFTGVNMTKVQKMSIGVGDRNAPQADGSGRIYIDDVRVIKP